MTTNLRFLFITSVLCSVQIAFFHTKTSCQLILDIFIHRNSIKLLSRYNLLIKSNKRLL